MDTGASDVVRAARSTLAAGPYTAVEERTVIHLVDGATSVIRARSVGYADPVEDLVVAHVEIDLGDDEIDLGDDELEEPVLSLYSQGHVLQPDATGAWIALDVAGIGSTILGPLVWLTGAVESVATPDGRVLVVVSPSQVVARAAEPERDALESALSMSQLDLLQQFSLLVTSMGTTAG